MKEPKYKLISMFLGLFLFLGTVLYRIFFMEDNLEGLINFFVATIALLMIVVPLYFKE